MTTFQMMTDELLASNVRSAKRRVVYIAPGIWLPVAEAISDYKTHNADAVLEIILDPNPQVYDFINDVGKLQAELNEFKSNVQSKLDDEFKSCKNSLISILGPAIKNNPPDELKYGINTSKPDESAVEKYLGIKLDSIIPQAENFVKDMIIRYQFKEVTYETLHEESFIQSLHKAFPYAGLPDIPINEYKAVRNKEW